MFAPAVRLLPDVLADGPHHMAADEVLLESAVAGTASLRFYGWSHATLSLGYFQPERLRLTDEQFAPLPWVRRATGGDALVHHHEITYALALPAGRMWQSHDTCARCVHRLLAAALASLGVTVHLHVPGKPAPFKGVLCFLHHTAGDLMLDGHKVVGSAQRKQRGALLQHGAILLAQSPHTPVLPGIRELTGRDLDPTAVRAAACKEFVHEMGWPLVEASWAEAEQRRTAELVTSKYGRPEWNAKR